MFDNPNRELRRLQDRLLASEEPETLSEDTAELLEQVDAVLSDENYPPRSRKKGRLVGLLILMIVESVALAALLTWWLLWR